MSYTPFPTNYGQSAWNSVTVLPISIDTPNHAQRPPKCRTAEIACTISELHALPPKFGGKSYMSGVTVVGTDCELQDRAVNRTVGPNCGV